MAGGFGRAHCQVIIEMHHFKDDLMFAITVSFSQVENPNQNLEATISRVLHLPPPARPSAVILSRCSLEPSAGVRTAARPCSFARWRKTITAEAAMAAAAAENNLPPSFFRLPRSPRSIHSSVHARQRRRSAATAGLPHVCISTVHIDWRNRK